MKALNILKKYVDSSNESIPFDYESESFIEIVNFFDKKLDNLIDNKNRPRYINQKCTPDVLFKFSKFLTQVKNEKNQFNVKNLFLDKNAEIFRTTFISFFRKPNLNTSSLTEYNGIRYQIISMLKFAGLLDELDDNREVMFITEPNILKLLSNSLDDCILFISIYTILYFDKNGLEQYLLDFLKMQNQSCLELLKNRWFELQYKVTEIKKPFSEDTTKTKELELHRVWPKAINTLCFWLDKKGSLKQKLSEIQLLDILYNKINFRDKDKNKNSPRVMFKNIVGNTKSNELKIKLAKSISKKLNSFLNSGESEYPNSKNDTKLLHVHHIVPVSENFEFASYIENLICLTPTEHLSYAHELNTRKINVDIQQLLISRKLEFIEKEMDKIPFGERLYNIENYKDILFYINKDFFNNNTCKDFEQIKNSLNEYRNYLKETQKIS